MEDPKDTKDTETNSNVKKAFRVQAKGFLVTYSRCPIPKEILIEWFKNFKPIEHIAVAEEVHLDGSPHLHIYVKFQQKINLKNERAWDYVYQGKNYHPSIEGMRHPPSAYQYVTKHGNYLEEFSWDFMSSNNFIRRKNDFEAFEGYIHAKKLKEFEGPLIFNSVEYPIKGVKKRHLCIITDPSWGKTDWVENTFEGFKIYKPVNGRYPMDNYNGEKILIFDDFMPEFSLS